MGRERGQRGGTGEASVDDDAAACLDELIVESRDLQSDAMRAARASIPDLVEVREARRGQPVDPSEARRFDEGRRALVRRLGLGAGGAAASGILGTTLATLLTRPAAADTPLDVRIMQTASSLEIVAINAYQIALGLPFIANGNPAVKKFAQTTMDQHSQHNKAFQSQARALGGPPQTAANPKYAKRVQQAQPTLKALPDVVELASTLEEVATNTYLSDLAMLTDTKSRSVMGSVMGVESQHLATLRSVGALLRAGKEELVKIPTDAVALPAAVGSVAFPEPFEPTTMASPPDEGAVR